MKVVTLVAVIVTVVVVSAKPSRKMKALPQFRLSKWESRSHVPSVDITFPDGHSDKLVLSRHYTSEESRMERRLHCNFLGYLENEMTACVAMTGCPGERDVEFTILSQHNAGYHMYRWNKDGTIEGVESEKRTIMAEFAEDEDEDKHDHNSNFSNGQIKPKNNKGQSRSNTVALDNCAENDNCDPLPSAMKLKIKVYYDTPHKNAVEQLDQMTVDDYIDACFTHAQVNYCDRTGLGTVVQIELIGGKTYAPDLEINTNVDLDAIWDTATNSDIEANLYSFFTYQETNGPSGRGYLGEVCTSTRWSRTHITERLSSVIQTSNTLTHEIGHNWGMPHDFDDDSSDEDVYKDKVTGETINLGTHKHQGCDESGEDGIMDYDWKTGWSRCSAFDILNHCRTHGNCDCLDPITPEETVCGASCGNPDGKGNGYCEDENNNAFCEYDGGDCCNNYIEDWAKDCFECQCKQTCPERANWLKDGYCDIQTNTQECDFDGGDCCDNDEDDWDKYCEDECICKVAPTIPTKYGTLLLAGGYNSDNQVEMIDLDKAESCNGGYKFPAGSSYRFPMSAYISEKDTLLSCGATSSNDEYENVCFELQPQGLADSTVPLPSERRYGDGIEHNGELYMLGGTAETDEDWMEHIAPGGGSVQKSPAKAGHNSGSCSVKLDENLVLYAGGFANDEVRTYNFEQDKVLLKAGLSKDRAYHDCALLKDKSGDAEYVVVVGGYSYSSSTGWEKRQNVEIYDIANNSWFDGPDMPASSNYPRLSTSVNGKSAFLVGIENKVYRIECNGQDCQWIDHGVELQVSKRTAHLQAIVSSSFCQN